MFVKSDEFFRHACGAGGEGRRGGGARECGGGGLRCGQCTRWRASCASAVRVHRLTQDELEHEGSEKGVQSEGFVRFLVPKTNIHNMRANHARNLTVLEIN